MEYEHLDYVQALKHLAEKFGIEWPEQEASSEEIAEEKRKKNEKESLQIINNFAEDYFSGFWKTTRKERRSVSPT